MIYETCKVAAVFSSNMVLQREKNIRIFGEGVDGKEVTCTLTLNEETTVKRSGIIKDGQWLVELPPQKALASCTLEVTCEAFSKTMMNVAIGEVWLCGGQSNMEMELQNIKGGQQMLQTDENPNVRFYYTQKRAVMDETFFEEEAKMCWKEFGPANAACWSGVGYLYGKQLAEKLGVTVGLIGCNWGGTSASAWTSREDLLENKEVAVYVTEYDKKIAGKTIAEQKAEYEAYERFNEEWQKKCNACYEKEPEIEWGEVQRRIGQCQWPGPINEYNPFRPAGLYETMLKRVAPYSMRGVIYYQGESDDHLPALYERLFGRMIREWRRLWGEVDLPFLFVQLPMHRYKQDPDFKHWCLIREAQFATFRTVRNTGMAVIIDAGEFNEIHPKDKVPVADRLCRQALCYVYHILGEETANGPLYRDCIAENGTMICRFDFAKHGFWVNKEVAEEIAGFELAGEDMQFAPAKARIEGENIVVSSEDIAAPEYVRYLWTNYGAVNLYGANGVPAAPFRSCNRDENKSQKVTTEIQQIMEL